MATYYTGKGGSDAADGTSWANRKLTVQAGENLCTGAGDILYVGAGVYSENVTFSNAGSSGNEITYIGDYTGANTDGTGGVVCINGKLILSAEYQTLQGVQAITATGGSGVVEVTADNVIVDNCYITNSVAGTADAIVYVGTGATSQSNVTVKRCVIAIGVSYGVRFRATSADAGNTGNVVENCIFWGAGSNATAGVYAERTAGITVRNCIFFGTGDSSIRSYQLPATEIVTVNNCIMFGARWPFNASAAGEIVEDYNAVSNFFSARVNVSTGANSTTDAPNLDPRWFFEATLGVGTLATPFDLSSDSTLVELNSGTGAPAADMRGTTVQGTYREWGPLEYDSTLDIEAGAGGIAYPVVGSSIIRGVTL